ncbi:hypothetical protein [Streptosporangium sp. NPDC087985]|uniref:hypothetical protein n=1 Tax=Streptosporangium sp. NPDC087985 TaxID=3366196 RepID=UPI0038206E18
MINVEAGRLREPAAWLMIAIASTSVLVGIERLLFGASGGKSSFGLRAAGYVDDFTSPVIVALLVGAVLLAGNLGPVVERLKLMARIAVAMLGLAALFGVVGLFGGLFSGDVDFGRKVEFLLVVLPGLALVVVGLLYLLPKAASAAPQVTGFRVEGGSGYSQEPYAQEQHVYPQGGPAPQAPPATQVYQPQEQAPQGGQGYPQGYQAQGFAPQEQAPQQGHPSQEQAPQQGYPPAGQAPQEQHVYPQGGPAPQAQPMPAPQGYQPQEQAPQGGQGYPQGYQAQGFAPQEQAQPVPAPQGYQPQEQAPQQGYPPQGGNAYPQAQPAPAPQPSYGQPALPPARSSAAASDGYGQQNASGYTPPVGDGYSQAPFAPPVENQPHGNQAVSYAPAQPAPQAPPAPAVPAETYTPSPYVAADVQPPAPATPYEPPVYAAAAEQPQQQVPGYPPSGAAQLPGYAPQPEQQQASFYQAEAPAPYGAADGQQRVSFDGQEQSSFPQPPENYGQPFAGYSGTDFARPTEPNLHYPAPDPADARSQQMAQAYQQAESYQQQSQGADPQFRVPEYGAAQPGGTYDDPFGHPQTPAAAQPYQQQGGHQWESPAESTLRFDPNAYQGDSPGGNSWDSHPTIDPTAIYRPERSAQVTGEETSDRERVGPGQEQNMSWYGSDRREH